MAPLIILTALLGIPVGVAVTALSDLVNGAIVTGIFTLFNTALNLLMIFLIRRTGDTVDRVEKRVHNTEKAARSGMDSLRDMANE